MATKKVTTVFTRKERWNMEVVDDLLSRLQPDHYDLPTLQIIKDTADENGYVTVPYTRERSEGRVYSKHGYQNLSGKNRNLCAKGFYHDYDLVNAFPNIMHQVFKKNGIGCKELTEYVTNRDAIFAKIMADQPALSRNEIKTCFLISLFFGNYKRSIGGISVPEITNFKDGIVKAAEELCTKDGYREKLAEAAAHIKKSGKTWKKPIATMLSWVCQDNEFQITQKFFEGLQLGPYMFDGEMSETLITDEELALRSEIVKRDLNFDVKVVEKPMVDADPPIHNPLGPREQMILFDLDGTLAFGQGGYKFRPGVKDISKLVIAGYKIGLFTNKSRKNIPVKELEAIIGAKFDSVLGNEECYRPSKEYLKAHPDLDQYDRLKPLRTFFPLDQVMIIDDTPSKIHSTERHRCIKIRTWERGSDTQLSEIINRILNRGIAGSLPTSTLNEGPLSRWAHGTSIITKDDKYCSKDDFVEPKVAVQCAAMGLGKTTSTRDYLLEAQKAYFEEHKTQMRVLVVGCRRTMNNATFKLYHSTLGQATHYEEFRENIHRKDDPVIICQYESLFKLKKVQPYDVIVIDEVREVAGCVTSTSTNRGRRLKNNIAMLELFMKKASKVICTDADIHTDGMVAHWLQSNFSPEDITVYNYTHKPIKRNIVLTKSEEDFERMIRESMKSGNLTALPCQTRTRVYSWMVKLGLVPSKEDADKRLPIATPEMKYITSEVPESERAKLSCIDDYLEGAMLFAFSAAITVGADCQIQTNKIFVDASAKSGMGCTARNLIQMIGRFRKVTDDEVVVLVGNYPIIDNQYAFAEALFEFENKTRSAAEGLEHCEFVPYYKKGCLEMAPTALAEMFVYTAAEKKRNIIYELERQALLKGWTFKRCEGKLTTTPEMAAIKEDLKEGAEEFLRAAYNCTAEFIKKRSVDHEIVKMIRSPITGEEEPDVRIFQALSPLDAIQRLSFKKRKLMSQGVANLLDKQVEKTTKTLLHFTEPLTYEEYIIAKDNVNQLKNLSEIISGDLETIAHNRVVRGTGRYANLGDQSSFDIHNKMKTILKNLGFENGVLSEGNISGTVIKANTANIKEWVCGIRPFSYNKKDKKAITILSKCLESTYGCIIEFDSRKRGKQGQARMYKITHSDALMALAKKMKAPEKSNPQDNLPQEELLKRINSDNVVGGEDRKPVPRLKRKAEYSEEPSPKRHMTFVEVSA